jgi:hypothetical protein
LRARKLLTRPLRSTGHRATATSAKGDGCADDREGDELQHGADEHDGCEPDVDGEPNLGWTVDGAIGNSDGMDREAGGSSVTEEIRFTRCLKNSAMYLI